MELQCWRPRVDFTNKLKWLLCQNTVASFLTPMVSYFNDVIRLAKLGLLIDFRENSPRPNIIFLLYFLLFQHLCLTMYTIIEQASKAPVAIATARSVDNLMGEVYTDVFVNFFICLSIYLFIYRPSLSPPSLLSACLSLCIYIYIQ